jgi:hypothetical protein
VGLRGSVPARVTLVYQPGRADAVLVAAGLSDPGQGKVYEVWYQPSTGASMHPAGVFAPSNGFAVVSVSVGKTFVLIAVTVERGPRGSPQPTTNPILSASI